VGVGCQAWGTVTRQVGWLLGKGGIAQLGGCLLGMEIGCYARALVARNLSRLLGKGVGC